MTSLRTILLAAGLLLLSGQGFAQIAQNGPQTAPYGEPQPFQSPLYTPPKQEPLDKNFGLPTLGMEGAGLPQQRTTPPPPGNTAPADPFATPQAPDSRTANRNATRGQRQGGASASRPPTDFPLPPAPPPVDGMPSTESETPLYSTTEGMTTGVGTTSIFSLPNPAGTADAAAAAATDDTPLFTTNQGATSDSVDSQFIAR